MRLIHRLDQSRSQTAPVEKIITLSQLQRYGCVSQFISLARFLLQKRLGTFSVEGKTSAFQRFCLDLGTALLAMEKMRQLLFTLFSHLIFSPYFHAPFKSITKVLQRIDVISSRPYRPPLDFCPCPRLFRHFGGVGRYEVTRYEVTGCLHLTSQNQF